MPPAEPPIRLELVRDTRAGTGKDEGEGDLLLWRLEQPPEPGASFQFHSPLKLHPNSIFRHPRGHCSLRYGAGGAVEEEEEERGSPSDFPCPFAGPTSGEFCSRLPDSLASGTWTAQVSLHSPAAAVRSSNRLTFARHPLPSSCKGPLESEDRPMGWFLRFLPGL